MQRVSPRASLIGLALAGGLVAAMLVFMLTMGGQGIPKAQAIVGTPVSTPTPKPATVASGVYDISVPLDGVLKSLGLYNCISRQDEYAGNIVKSAAVCYVDAGGSGAFGIGDPNAEPPSGSLRISKLPPATDAGKGPPPPPPYTVLSPSKGYGNINGGTLHSFTCFADIGGTLGPNLIAEVIVPNFHAQFTAAPFKAQAGAGAPGALGAPGTGLYLYTGRGQNECDNVALGIPPKGANQTNPGSYLNFTKTDPADPACGAGPCALAPWRVGHSATNWDQDGCTDSNELFADKLGTKCGDDPWNPNDVNTGHSDVSGVWSILVTAAREDVCWGATWKHQGEVFQYDCTGKADGTKIPGFYYTCDSYITQDTPGDPQALNAKVLCYIDFAGNGLLPNGYTVNPDAAGGGSCNNAPAAKDMCGNGSPGAAPPGCNDMPGIGLGCANTMPNASNMVTGPGHCAAVNKGPGLFYVTTITCHPERWLFAQISNPGPPSGNATTNPKKQSKLVGTYNKTSNNIELSGCFNNNNARVPDIAPVYTRAKINAHTGHGFVSLWTLQDAAACKGATFTPTGSPLTLPIDIVRQACVAPGTDNTCVESAAAWDTDGDGCVDSHELSDTPAGADGGGMRDPSNRWDFFDPFKEASPVGGLKKHNATDMLIVQQHFGANEWIKDPANQVNPPVLNDGVVNPAIKAYSPAFDRTAIAGSNSWNLGPGDGYVNAHDMLAVQKSFGHTCPQTIPTSK